MKRLLIVSPHFPPTNAPDMHRARTALPHLRALGWDATVLAVDPRDIAASRDEALATALPPEVRIIRCRAWPLHVTRRFGLRTLGWRSWRALDHAGSRLLRAEKFDLVLFTTTQFLITTLGARWRRRFGVPYVIDLQDPWITDYYERPGAPRPPGGWKYRFARFIAKKFEARAFHDAAGFVSVSPSYLQTLAERYAWFPLKPQVTIPFGVDPREYATIPPDTRPAFTRDPGGIHLVSVGAIGSIMTPALRALLVQLKSLHIRSPEIAARVKFHFIGTSYAPPDQAQPSVLPLAIEYGVADQVSEQTTRVSWYVAQATMQAADGLLILTSDEGAYTPSKIAGCFLARRPVLVVTSADTGAARLTVELGLGPRLDPISPAPESLADFLQLLGDPAKSWIAARREDLFQQRHTAAARSQSLADFLHQLSPITLPFTS